ncbi:MAG: polysaccharide biosynthesis protein [Bacteroidales bacterium]|nr:polysaccharide biosynthesis protein [Bacteroidales bacterium]
MVKLIVDSLSDRYISRWLIFTFDIFLVVVTLMLALLVQSNFNFPDFSVASFLLQLRVILVIYAGAFLFFRTFSGIVRQTSLSDAYNIFKAITWAFVIILAFTVISEHLQSTVEGEEPTVPVLVMQYLLLLVSLMGSRFFVKAIYNQIIRLDQKNQIGVIIYGTGTAGVLTKNTLQEDKEYNYKVIAFVDNNPYLAYKTLEGIPIVSYFVALRSSYVKRHNIKQLIISIPNLAPSKKKEIIEICLKLGVQVKVVPALNLWINGQFNAHQLERVKIEELLQRDPILLDSKNVYRELKNKVIMITGAAGSIGSELALQVLNHSPKRVVLVDQAESAIYTLQYELSLFAKEKGNYDLIEFIVASVKDRFRMTNIMETYRPDIIFHAAAYKHVPLMEENPYEALMVNVFGTKIMADLALKFEVEKFVMISTDKAVNPTNIMGASKRIAEIYVHSLANGKTRFVTTRFGNVLGSNGSVVPLFRKQIEQGGPVTITHKEITRYFMTIQEACSLVLEAGAMGKGDDIFVFDMGQPVKIYDLAVKMILLYGFKPGVDIEIQETGLRMGEKLYEELLTNSEDLLLTPHPKIMRARVSGLTLKEVTKFIDELTELIIERDEFLIVQKMKEIVPEFISNNSVFQVLDKKG